MNGYVIKIERLKDDKLFYNSKAISDVELDGLTPAIVKDICWELIKQLMEIEQ